MAPVSGNDGPTRVFAHFRTIPEKELKTFDAKQSADFLKAAKTNRLYAMYVLAITTGLRQGELIALHWDDVDLDAAVRQVRRTVTYGHKTKAPKTKREKDGLT
ncbi:MAG TPA: tyrosine-type recombinase/integrase [Lacipirellulaceae bacterium]|nr:tyrosine-type recombinase/integrase [Lacipirellulaceae bacterium]